MLLLLLVLRRVVLLRVREEKLRRWIKRLRVVTGGRRERELGLVILERVGVRMVLRRVRSGSLRRRGSRRIALLGTGRRGGGRIESILRVTRGSGTHPELGVSSVAVASGDKCGGSCSVIGYNRRRRKRRKRGVVVT